MRIAATTAIVILAITWAGGRGSQALGQISGRPVKGYCRLCGKDMPLAHDFTHGGGTRRPPPPPPPPADPSLYSVVALDNRTDRDVSYSIRSLSGGGWTTNTIPAGKGYSHWHQSSSDFQIQFTADGAEKLYRLESHVVRVTQGRPEFKDGRNYHFAEVGTSYDLRTGAGVARTPRNQPAPKAPDDAFGDLLKQLSESGERTRKRMAAEQAREAHRQGLDAWKVGNWAVALQHFEEAVRLNPEAAESAWYAQRARDAVAEEQQRRAKTEAENRAKQQISKVIEEGLRNLDRGAPSGSARVGGTDGLRFDSVPAGPTATKNPSGKGLDFSDVAGTQTLFEKGSPGSAPVPVPADPLRQAFTDRIRPHGASLWVASVRPGKEPYERLPNPLDTARIAREKALLKPLDLDAFLALTEDDAFKLLRDRRDAAVNEAGRRAREEVGEAIRQLRQDGRLGPNEDVLQRQRKDPQIAAAVSAAVQQAADREVQRIRDAHRTSVAHGMAYYARQADLAELKLKLEAVFERGAREEEAQRRAASDKAIQQVTAIYDDLKRRGLLDDIQRYEDWERKEQTDPAFRHAAERSRQIRDALIRAEQEIRNRSLQKMQAELTELVRQLEARSGPP